MQGTENPSHCGGISCLHYRLFGLWGKKVKIQMGDVINAVCKAVRIRNIS